MTNSKRNYVLDWQTGLVFQTDKNYKDLVDGMTAAWEYLKTDTQIIGPYGKLINIDKRIYIKDLYKEFLDIGDPRLDGLTMGWNRIVTSRVENRNDLMVKIKFMPLPWWPREDVVPMYVVYYPYALCYG